MEKYPIIFSERDFTEKGKEVIYDLYGNLKKDIISSQDGVSDKKEALDRLENFLEGYEYILKQSNI